MDTTQPSPSVLLTGMSGAGKSSLMEQPVECAEVLRNLEEIEPLLRHVNLQTPPA